VDTVKTQVILGIPKREEFIGVLIGDILEIVGALRNSANGVIELASVDERRPFDLIVAAEKSTTTTEKAGDAGEDTTTKPAQETERIIVFGIGQSYLDSFLQNDVLMDPAKLRFDPPPTENLDLFVNAVFWLNDTPEYVGRGPVPVPRITAIPSSEQTVLRALLWGVWPALVLAPGIVLWFLRRR